MAGWGWCTPIILVPGRLRQQIVKLEVSLSYVAISRPRIGGGSARKEGREAQVEVCTIVCQKSA